MGHERVYFHTLGLTIMDMNSPITRADGSTSIPMALLIKLNGLWECQWRSWAHTEQEGNNRAPRCELTG